MARLSFTDYRKIKDSPMNIRPHSRLTFNPQTPRNDQEAQAYQRGDSVNTRAYGMNSMVRSFDQGEHDLDSRDGYVRLENYARTPGSGSLSATLTPNSMEAEVFTITKDPLSGERWTAEQLEYEHKDHRTVRAARSEFIQGRDFLPSATEMTVNPDGTVTVTDGYTHQMPQFPQQ